MGCVYPVKIENKHYVSGSVKLWQRNKYYYVPCGKCLNCQISKRKWLNTACNYEYNHYGCGAFVTLTYDEINYLRLYDDEKDEFLLRYDDFQNFMKRLRTNIYRKYGVNHEFKYLAVGEYGGQTGRCHYHVLFFGLDFRNNDLDIYNAWGFGMTDSKPIKTGGINYVLKYMDKSELRKKDRDFFRKEQEPFLKHSLGLGKGFIIDNLDDILKNNGTYKLNDGTNKRYSLPSYWLNKINCKPIVDYTDVRKQIGAEYKKDWKTVTKTECINYMTSRNRLIEQSLINNSRNKGIPQEDFDEDLSVSLCKLRD